MKRRNFILSTGVCLISHKIVTKFKSHTRFNNPPLVFDHDKQPALIVPKDNSNLYLELPENTESDNLLLVANEYGRPDRPYYKQEHSLDGDNELSVDLPPIDGKFAYTLYEKKSDNLNYIGESNPLEEQNGNIIEVTPQEIKDKKTIHPMSRERMRGYYNIKIQSNNDEIEYPVSYQKYQMGGRILGYGKAKNEALSNPFLESLANSIIDQSDSETEYQKIISLTEFVQNMEWKGDLKTAGKFEYIRDPALTLVNMYGDCKDRTVLNNGLLSNGLDIETIVMFSPGHMFTGINFGDLNDKTVEELKENADKNIGLYGGTDSEYIAIDSTNDHKIGIEYPEPIYAIYTDNYEIRNYSGLYKHLKKTISVATNGDYSGT